MSDIPFVGSLAGIRQFPTTIAAERCGPRDRIHESVLRSYQCVQKVKELLRHGCPAPVLLQIIDDIMGAPQTDWPRKED